MAEGDLYRAYLQKFIEADYWAHKLTDETMSERWQAVADAYRELAERAREKQLASETNLIDAIVENTHARSLREWPE